VSVEWLLTGIADAVKPNRDMTAVERARTRIASGEHKADGGGHPI
jgi:hypothetical protein